MPNLLPPWSSSLTPLQYLEGEIIDFNHHSFKTTNFKSDVTTDAQNWRKLEPFVNMTNEEIVRGLLSRKFMKELANHWVFMRWKGLCSVHLGDECGDWMLMLE